MALTEVQQREEAQKSALNAGRYRKQTLQQGFREDLMRQDRNTEDNTDIPQESAHKNRLAMLKAGAIKRANTQGGAALGASVGGTVGSVIPVVGTGIGIFLGRFVGKKAGITGIIIFAILFLLFLLVIFIALLKGYCDTWTGWATDKVTLGICESLE